MFILIFFWHVSSSTKYAKQLERKIIKPSFNKFCTLNQSFRPNILRIFWLVKSISKCGRLSSEEKNGISLSGKILFIEIINKEKLNDLCQSQSEENWTNMRWGFSRSIPVVILPCISPTYRQSFLTLLRNTVLWVSSEFWGN